MVGSGMKRLIISNEEMDDIIKIVKSFEESGFLIKSVSKTIKNQAKPQRVGLLGMLLVTLCASLIEQLKARLEQARISYAAVS